MFLTKHYFIERPYNTQYCRYAVCVPRTGIKRHHSTLLVEVSFRDMVFVLFCFYYVVAVFVFVSVKVSFINFY